MSNGISNRQNEDSSIARLAAQRQLYREVNKAEIINVILTVVIPISLSIIREIAGWVKIVTCIVSLIMLGLSSRTKNIGAELEGQGLWIKELKSFLIEEQFK